MIQCSRRHFLSRVGSGIGSLAVGAALVERFAPSWAAAAIPIERLRFGALDPLVDLVQSTPADDLMAVSDA